MPFFEDETWLEAGAKNLSKIQLQMAFEKDWNTMPKICPAEMSVENYYHTSKSMPQAESSSIENVREVMSLEKRFYFHLFSILLHDRPTLFDMESPLILDKTLLPLASIKQRKEAVTRASIDVALYSLGQAIQNYNPIKIKEGTLELSDPSQVQRQNVDNREIFLRALHAHIAFFNSFRVLDNLNKTLNKHCEQSNWDAIPNDFKEFQQLKSTCSEALSFAALGLYITWNNPKDKT